jgi:hypothetical protein
MEVENDGQMEVEEEPVTPVFWSCMNCRRDLIEHCLMDYKDKIRFRRIRCFVEKKGLHTLLSLSRVF